MFRQILLAEGFPQAIEVTGAKQEEHPTHKCSPTIRSTPSASSILRMPWRTSISSTRRAATPAPYQFSVEEYVAMVGIGENIAEWEDLAETAGNELRGAASSACLKISREKISGKSVVAHCTCIVRFTVSVTPLIVTVTVGFETPTGVP
jgi:hypothetical protein